MNTRNMLTGFFLVLAVLTEGAIALSSTKGNNSVTVLARGPAGLRIEGKGSEVSLEEDDSALTFKVPLAPIETGISLRDVHLHHHDQRRDPEVHRSCDHGSAPGQFRRGLAPIGGELSL